MKAEQQIFLSLGLEDVFRRKCCQAIIFLAIRAGEKPSPMLAG